jgi:hypothetical protein
MASCLVAFLAEIGRHQLLLTAEQEVRLGARCMQERCRTAAGKASARVFDPFEGRTLRSGERAKEPLIAAT